MKKILLSMAVVAAAMLTACSGNSEKTESGANSTAAESLNDGGEIDVVEEVIYNPDSTVTPAASTATDAAAAAGQQAQGKAPRRVSRKAMMPPKKRSPNGQVM